MSKTLWDYLADKARFESIASLSAQLEQRLRRLSEELSLMLRDSDPTTRAEILAQLSAEVIRHLPGLELTGDVMQGKDSVECPNGSTDEKNLITGKINSDIRAWAIREFNEEETLAGLREIRETGGFALNDFLKDLESEALPHD